MVECGNISQKPSKQITIFMIVEIFFLLVIFLSSIGLLVVFIRDLNILPNKGSGYAAFLAEPFMVTGIICIFLGYCQNKRICLTVSFVCFIIIALFDVFIFTFGMLHGYHVVYFKNIVRFTACSYVSFALYNQIFKGEGSSEVLLKEEQQNEKV